MNIIEDVPQQLNPVNLHEDNLVALPLINLFVEACHVIFLRKLDKNSMPHKRRSSFELLVLQYTLDNTPDNSEAGIQLFIGITANGLGSNSLRTLFSQCVYSGRPPHSEWHVQPHNPCLHQGSNWNRNKFWITFQYKKHKLFKPLCIAWHRN